MIIVKGLLNFNNLKKYIFNLAIIGLIISFVYIFSYNINKELNEGLNKIEYRTAIVKADNYDYLFNKYYEYIESKEINDNDVVIVFKDVKYLNKFILNESNFIDITSNIGESMSVYKVLSVALSIILICLYIFLFIMIFMFNIDYLNKSIIDIKLYMYLGYNKIIIYSFYLLFLIILYCFMYLFFGVLLYFILHINIFNLYYILIILLINIISLMVFNNYILKNVK